MPTKDEWLQLAKEHERKAHEYYEQDDLLMGDVYTTKADACRECAVYAAEREDSHE